MRPAGNAPRKRKETLVKWQSLWDEEIEKAQWTKTLIPNIEKWVGCRHRSTDYFLSQFLAGHGRFGSYTNRMNLKPSDRCNYCN